MIYLVLGAFKSNQEILSNASIIPQKLSLDGFVNGWTSTGGNTFLTYLLNTMKLVLPTVLFTMISSTLVAYGFARFNFFGKKQLFILLISTLMLPNAVLLVPRYLIFRNFNWLDTYMPFIIPAAFATFPFFVFMMVQFIRSIPTELDEAAQIDGCNSFMILWRIILPVCKPALFSVGIFQFVWTWNDFFNALIYISSVDKFTIQLALRMTLDIASQTNWNQIMAMSLISILPPIILFFTAQKYFVEGISTSGLKG
jgi:oligogalacturonide transport system permease protein